MKVKWKQEGGRRLESGVPIQAIEFRKEDPSPFFGLQGTEDRLHAIAEVAIIKGKAVCGIQPDIDHNPIQAGRGQFRRQVGIHLVPHHDIGNAESALLDDLGYQELDKSMQISEDADIRQVNGIMLIAFANQRNAQCREFSRRFLKRRCFCVLCLLFLDQCPDHVADVTLHLFYSPSFKTMA